MLSMLFEYEVLRVIWWLLLGVLLVGYAIMDGFDLGVATLLQFIAKTEMEKKILINTIEPYWEGNQVWLILGGGAIFAAWPAVYAVSFSGMYIPMFLLLFALIVRPVAFTFRSKYENKTWKGFWSWMHFVSGILPSILCGLAIGNVMLGLPFKIDSYDLSMSYHGTFFDLFNPFALLCGFVSLCMLIMHGSVYAALKTEGIIAKRAKNIVKIAGVLLLLSYSIGGIMTAFVIKGYVITSVVITNGPSYPFNKQVVQLLGGWFHNFSTMPLTLIAPVFVFLGVLVTFKLVSINKMGLAFISSSIAILGVVSTAGLVMFPFILPSSIDLNSSLTVWDSSSSALTLKVMLIATIIFMPMVIIYTSWVFKVLKGKITEDTLEEKY